MKRRRFLTLMTTLAAGVLAFITTSGCIAPLIGKTARDQASGKPWRCENCGHLTRSNEDLSGTRCPRCKKRQLKEITEEEMRQRLEEAEARREEKAG